MEYTLKNDFYTITVNTLGAELVSVKDASGYEHIWQNKPEFWKGHAPLLFPVCGKLKDSKYTYGAKEYDMSGHGFINKCEFRMTKCSDMHIVMEYSSNEDTLKIYPFEFSVIADYSLEKDAIKFDFTVKNAGERVMPYMFGWHPAFNLPCEDGQDIEDYKLHFGGRKSLVWHPLQNGVFVRPEGENYALTDGAYRLNEKEIYENDTMIFMEHGNRLTMSADGHPYRLDIEWSENLPALCIWKWPSNEAKYVCIEPWSGTPADGVIPENFETRKMERLIPSESAVYSYSVKITK